MEIKVVTKQGIFNYSFNCPNEFGGTIRRYLFDPSTKITVKP
ncbi:hypothetical protein P7D52_10395 [Enterococcus dongliensis]|nr:hypothetical protein [Enterococcus dongliensis]MDT2613125.1 hypothetical protein [Enterococcus dongliensis]MDT2643195.1 hypothetical protein [Enterococcus dongliensis]